MKKLVGTVFFCGILSASPAQMEADFAFPESVIRYQEFYLVSNVGMKLNAETDGDGFITKIDLNGQVLDSRFLPTGKEKLHAPKGMAILDTILYVTDIDRVIGFDLLTRAKVFEIDMSDRALFLNDLVALPGGALLTSDSFKNILFKIDIEKGQYETNDEVIAAVNGLAIVGNKVFSVTMGPGMDGNGKVYSNGKPTPGSPTGMLDGLQVIDRNVLVSDWSDLKGAKGRFYLYDTVDHSFKTSSLELVSPADFYFDPLTQNVIIPQMLLHRVIVVPLSTLFPGYGNIDRLYHFGLIDALLSGLYEGALPYGALKLKGDFGLGAPDRLGGEITVLDGKVYQTKADGQTVEPHDSETTSYAFVTKFKADFTQEVGAIDSKEAFELQLSKRIPKDNAMYVLRVSGSFSSLRTRAFPKINSGSHPRLASILDRQVFFDFSAIEGTLVGFYLPGYLQGINVPGFHFHFLSSDKNHGGHVLEISVTNAKVEFDRLTNFEVQLPEGQGFKSLNFKVDRSADVQKAESGKK